MSGSSVSQAAKTRLTTVGIGRLGTAVYKEVQYEAQVDRLRRSSFLGLREDNDPDLKSNSNVATCAGSPSCPLRI
jgi:hypothetical protein